MKYTNQDLDRCIKSIDDVLEKNLKVRDLQIELKRTLKRIQFALNPDYEIAFKAIYDKTKLEELKKIHDNEDFKSDFKNYNMLSIRKAKLKLIQEFKYLIPHSDYLMSYQWEDLKGALRWQHKRDREQLIKEGQVKEVIKV